MMPRMATALHLKIRFKSSAPLSMLPREYFSPHIPLPIQTKVKGIKERQ